MTQHLLYLQLLQRLRQLQVHQLRPLNHKNNNLYSI